MSFDLPHVASRVYGTPLLISRPKLDVILSVLGPRLQGEPLASSGGGSGRGQLRITDAGVAVLPVLGTLVRRSSWMGAVSGMTSYHDIQGMAEEAFTNPEVKAVLLEIDSCGGEAGGVFDLAESLAAMSESTGKPLWAVADEAALSAAYAIACSASRIIVPRTAEVGSIGVVAVHVDESGADAQAGLSYTYIHAGAHKVDGHPHSPLAAEVHDRLQADVDALYADFVALAAARRNCGPDLVRNTEARVYRGQDAVTACLADAVGTFQQAHDELAALVQRQSVSQFTSKTMQKEPSMTHESIQAPALEALTDPVALAREAEAKVCGRMKELASIASQAKRLGIDVDPVEALQSGITPDALRDRVLKEASDRDTHDVQSFAAPQQPQGSGDALLKAVQKLHPKGGA